MHLTSLECALRILVGNILGDQGNQCEERFEIKMLLLGKEYNLCGNYMSQPSGQLRVELIRQELNPCPNPPPPPKEALDPCLVWV